MHDYVSEGIPKTTAVAKDMAKVLAYTGIKYNAKYAAALLGKPVVPLLLEHSSLLQNMKTIT